MKLLAALLPLTFALATCGSPSDEDKLSPEAIRASESAPELPEVNLSEDPEPSPATPAAEPANEIDDGLNDEGPASASPESALIPSAFHGRWGQVVDDCTDPRRPGSTSLVVSADGLDLPDASGRLARTLDQFPERFIGEFLFNGDLGRWASREELALTGSSNVLIREADGERFRYRRCVRPKV